MTARLILGKNNPLLAVKHDFDMIVGVSILNFQQLEDIGLRGFLDFHDIPIDLKDIAIMLGFVTSRP
jgi:hypothetical protein